MGLLGGDPLLDCDLEEFSEFEFWFWFAEEAGSSGDLTRFPCSSPPPPAPPPPPPSLSLTSAAPPSALLTSCSAFPAGAGLPTLLSEPPFSPPPPGLGLLDFLDAGLLDRDPLRDLGFSRTGDRDLDRERERGDAVLEATLATFLFLSWKRLAELFFLLFELLLSVFRSLASSACIDLSLSDISVT